MRNVNVVTPDPITGTSLPPTPRRTRSCIPTSGDPCQTPRWPFQHQRPRGPGGWVHAGHVPCCDYTGAHPPQLLSLMCRRTIPTPRPTTLHQPLTQRVPLSRHPTPLPSAPWALQHQRPWGPGSYPPDPIYNAPGALSTTLPTTPHRHSLLLILRARQCFRQRIVLHFVTCR